MYHRHNIFLLHVHLYILAIHSFFTIAQFYIDLLAIIHNTHFVKYFCRVHENINCLPKKCWNSVVCFRLGTKILSKCVAYISASAQNLFCLIVLIPNTFIIVHNFPYNVANLCSKYPFRCGVPGVVYSKVISSPLCLHNFSKAQFSTE